MLLRPSGPSPLIWRNPDCTVFALCQVDGSAPPGAADPELREIATQWMTATPHARAVLLCRLISCGQAAGRALAVLAGPPADDPDRAAEDEDDAPGPEQPAEKLPSVDWLALARSVLADPPLTRLDAAHGAAIELLGKIGEPADRETLARYFLQHCEPLNLPLHVSTLEALYWHCRRTGEPLVELPLLAAVTALARDGTGDGRRHAVLLLGRFAAVVTGDLLRELTHDPTHTVCCIAERALAEQERG